MLSFSKSLGLAGLVSFSFAACGLNNSTESTVARNSTRSEVQRCAERVRAACYLSNNDVDRIEDNVRSCKQLRSADGADVLEIFLLKDSGKVVTIPTKTANPWARPTCSRQKYDVDTTGIDEIKIVGNIAYMLGNSGRVYFTTAKQSMYELLNSLYSSYSSVVDIKGSQDGNSVTLIHAYGFQNEITNDELLVKVALGQVDALSFYTVPTNRSLFRDE